MVLRVGYPLKIAVVGYQNSGKTYAAELTIKALKSYPLKILAVKHVPDDSFSIDRRGSDSWRMRSAGADAVIVASPKELSVIYPGDGGMDYGTPQYQRIIRNYDVIVMEGFKDKALSDPSIAKILCVRNTDDLNAFNSKLKGDLVASCSLSDLDGLTLILGRQDDELRRRVTEYFEYFTEVKRIMGELPRLDCGRCGYPSCFEMAKAIYSGRRKLENCPVASSSLDVEVEIGDSKLPMQPFVARMIKSTVLGMISSLKGVEITGDEKLKIKIIQ